MEFDDSPTEIQVEITQEYGFTTEPIKYELNRIKFLDDSKGKLPSILACSGLTMISRNVFNNW